MPRLLAIIHIPVFGGPHNQVIQLAPLLSAQGWETLMLLPTEPGSAAERIAAAGVPLLQIPLHRLRAQPNPRVQFAFLRSLLPEIAHIRRIIRTHQIDLVQVGGLMNPHGAIAAHLAGIPVVWQLLGTTAPMALRRVLMPLVVRLADVVMSTGRRVAQLHPGATRLGERLITFFPPVNPSFFDVSPARRAAARAELGIPPDALVLGTVGNLNKLKGHEFLLRAAAIIHAQHPHVVTRILGEPTTHADYYERSVKAEASQLGLLANDRLRFVNPGARVADLLPAFDLFLLTSRQEGVPTVILEAMANGLPVVATHVGSVHEVVAHGVTGLLVPSGDHAAIARATLKLIERPALRQQMGHIARQHAYDHYTIEACRDTHLHAYAVATAHRQHRHSPIGSRSL